MKLQDLLKQAFEMGFKLGYVVPTPYETGINNCDHKVKDKWEQNKYHFESYKNIELYDNIKGKR